MIGRGRHASSPGGVRREWRHSLGTYGRAGDAVAKGHNLDRSEDGGELGRGDHGRKEELLEVQHGGVYGLVSTRLETNSFLNYGKLGSLIRPPQAHWQPLPHTFPRLEIWGKRNRASSSIPHGSSESRRQGMSRLGPGKMARDD